MKLAALFSGGKDSIYSIYVAQKNGHQIKHLITINPFSSDSMLLHHPNTWITKLQSLSMNISHTYIKSYSNDTNYEIKLIQKNLEKIKTMIDIDGIVHGGILSKFQINIFNKICSALNLQLYTPLYDTSNYLYHILKANIHFIISSVSSDGLDHKWLGKEITFQDIDHLDTLSNTYGFNINFDGGEAETLVTDCTFFTYPIKFIKTKKIWDGYRGIFDIEEAILDSNVK